jgi:hypothetical protein
MNENSLANLKKPKTKKNYGYRYALPQDKIDKLFELLVDNCTLRKAAKKIDICYATAKKYFEKGDSRRGIQPLKLRLHKFKEVLTTEFDSQLLERRKYFIDIVSNSIKQFKEQVDNKVLIGKASFQQLATLMKLEIWLRGGEVKKREIEEGELTAEDIRRSAKN